MTRAAGRGARLRPWALAVLASLAVPGVVACGEGSETEEDRVTAAVEQLHEDLSAGRIREVCAAMTARPQRQIGSVGHGRKPTSCDADLRELLQGMRASAQAAEDPSMDLSRAQRPEVVDVVFGRGERDATVTLKLDRGEFRVPFAKRDGDWRLADFFGAQGPPPRALR